MSTLEKIQALNPDKTIYQLTDSAFSDYGVTYTQYDVSELQQFMDQQVPIPAPTAANRYIPSNRLVVMFLPACQSKPVNVPDTPRL